MKDLKQKLLNRETISYIIFGILTTAVDFVVYIMCSKLLGINYLVANIISWIAAVIFAFVTNKIFVFKSKSYSISTLINEIPAFFSARFFSLIFSLVFIYMSVVLIGVNDIVAKIISCIFVIVINYILSKFFIFTNGDDNKKTFSTRVKNNLMYIVAFMIPVIIMVIIYYMRKIFPFGEEMYLRSDCYHQYAPFHKEFFNKLKNGGSLTYSWNIGLGVNFSALYAYYLASPLNWFIAIFPEKNIIEVMNAFIILKAGLCSFTFAYYISKHFKSKHMCIAAFSIFYALSSYFAAFCWNVMWLDCLILLPLILLGLERLVKENKCFLYCISLGLAITSNYYIAIMICIFCVLYYFAMLYSDKSKKNINFYINRTLNFGLYSLIAGGFAAAVFLPAYFALKSTASGEFNFPELLQNYFSILDMMSRSLIDVEASIFSAHDPNIYCTVAVFLLIPLYFMCSKIDFREKIAKAAILAFMLFSFNTNIPNYIWHGFHFPNSLPCRQSFIFIFLILAMSYEAFIHIKSFSNKQLFGAFSGAAALILIIEELYVSDEYDFKIIYYSLGFIILYMIAFMLYRSDNYRHRVVIFFIFVITASEAYINLNTTGISTTSRTYYVSDNKDIDTVLQNVQKDDKGFYRVEKYDRHTKNDAGWNNYRGASTFSSTALAKLSEYYGQMGMQESTNAYAYYGHTPLTEALFSIKYVLGDSFMDDNDLITLDTASGGTYLYENNYTLPLGFMIKNNFEDDWDFDNSDPFAVQNSFAANVIGDEGYNLFTRLNVDSDGSNAQVSASEKIHLFVYVTTSLDKVDVEVQDSEGNAITNKTYSDMNHQHILDLGIINAGETVYVNPNDEEKTSLQLYAYDFDLDTFVSVYDELNSNPLVIDTFEDNYIKGKINVETGGMLYTSIPYDNGWTAYVDGEETKTKSLEGALLGISLNSGTHTIELKYSPEGLNLGISISILSIIAFVSLVVLDYNKKKRERSKVITEE
ncbi:MAG: YfhO family protein [Lachnospiraceae bacterium]|nr:YfhO family protein [Lachnospiraceae bacterium]